MKYEWNESMSTGVPRLDAQHKVLIEKFSEFSKIIKSRGEIREAAAEALDFLQFYATWHFRQEEEYMEKYNCPVAESNKQAHKDFLVQFGALYEHWQTGTMDQKTARETHEKLAEWIMSHIIHTDTKLKDYAPKP